MALEREKQNERKDNEANSKEQERTIDKKHRKEELQKRQKKRIQNSKGTGKLRAKNSKDSRNQLDNAT